MKLPSFLNAFPDWIKGGLGWVSNNIVKPVLGGFSWAKNNKIIQGGLAAANTIGKYSDTVGKYANIAQQVIDKGDSLNQTFQSNNGDLLKTAGTYFQPGAGVTQQGRDLMQWKG